MIIQKNIIFPSPADFEKWQMDNAGKISPEMFTTQPILLLTHKAQKLNNAIETAYMYGIFVTFHQEINEVH